MVSSVSRRSFVAGGALACAAAASLTGCGGSSDTSSSSSTETAAVTGGTLTAATAYTSQTCNPIGNSSALMLAATWHVFDGLYNLDLRTYKTYLGLAAAEPTKVSDTEYEVALRDGAKFSDGTAVTADDVVYSFEQNMANSTYSAFLTFIDSVTKKDDTTVTFKLKYAFESLLTTRLAIVKIFPASCTTLDTMPIGSGPWAYKSINGDDGGLIEFTPNANYVGDFAATADAMEWKPLKSDPTARVTALQEGTVEVMEDVPAVNVDQLTAAGATVEYKQSFCQAFLMFNTSKKPFDDYRVRQAFFYAIDTDKLIQNTMSGNASAVTGFLTEDHPNYKKASTVYTYDMDKAKSLLSEAGVSDLSITLTVNTNWVNDLGPQIKNDLEAIGITCQLADFDSQWGNLVANGYDVMLTPGDPTCFGNDPDLLMSWWYGDNIWTSDRTCWALASDGKWAELQTKMQQAREASDTDQQTLWNECMDIIAEQVPLYALFHKKIATGYLADKIDGFQPIATTGLVLLGCSNK